MTIREYIERRRKMAMGVMALWMIGIGTFAALYPSYWHGRAARGGPWFAGTLILTFALIGLIHWRTKCPRCHSTFPDRTIQGQKTRWWIDIAEECPRCHVKLNEQIGR